MIILFTAIGIATIGIGIGLYFLIVNLTFSKDAETYVSIAINPAVEFTVNDDDKVISVAATDAEGDEIIQNYDFYKMDIDEACEKFTELCVEAGYIDVTADATDGEENDVVITVVNNAETTQATIRERIRTQLKNYFINNGIYGVVTDEDLSAYQTLATENNISLGKVKIINRALAYNPELTFDELKDLSVQEITNTIKEVHKNIAQTTQTVIEQLRLDIEALKTSDTYADMFTLIYEIEDLKEQLEDTTLTTEQIAALQTTLAEKQADFDANYADLFEQFKEDRADLFEQAKTDSTALLQQIKNQYRTKVENYKSAMNELKERVKNSSRIKDEVRAWLEGLED